MRPAPGCGVVAGILLVAGTALLPSSHATSPALPKDVGVCVGVPVGEGDARGVDPDALLGQGWFGLPGDGEERLYPPACAAWPWPAGYLNNLEEGYPQGLTDLACTRSVALVSTTCTRP